MSALPTIFVSYIDLGSPPPPRQRPHASHHLDGDEFVAPCLGRQQVLGGGDAIADGDLAEAGNQRCLDALADAPQWRLFQQERVRRAEKMGRGAHHRLHHAAGGGEDLRGAGARAQWMIEFGLFRQRMEGDTA